MKFNFDIECTPQEARTFFGLPDVIPLQETMMKELEEKMQDNIRNLDPETLVRTWLPATIQGWGEVQKIFWSQMGMSMPPGMDKAPGAGPGTAKKANTGKE